MYPPFLFTSDRESGPFGEEKSDRPSEKESFVEKVFAWSNKRVG